MKTGDRIKFTNILGGPAGHERDGREATVNVAFANDCRIRFDDGCEIYADNKELEPA